MAPRDPGFNPRRQSAYIGLAFLVTLPGVVIRLAGIHPHPVVAAAIFGIAIVGAAFMLSWAAEVVQLDISAGLALALLALIAILPEYAVDFVFTWKAGKDPDRYAHLALANMTGANQLLIGLGWPMVVLIGTWRVRRMRQGREGRTTATEVGLDRPQSVEIAYLTIASLYGLTLPLRTSLHLFDAIVLVGIYVAYLLRIAKAPPSAPHLVGPAAAIGMMGTTRRRTFNVGMFVVSAGVILACAEPFAESLVSVGDTLGISEFLLVKWLAPLASEAPEFLVAGLFAWRLSASTGLGALLSSKVNQWTLLVGTLPIVFALSASGLDGLPLDIQQRDELLVTAAQSIFAVAILASRSMSITESWVLLVLFVGQFVSGGLIHEQYAAPGRIAVGAVFILGAVWVLLKDRSSMRTVLRDGLLLPYDELQVETV